MQRRVRDMTVMAESAEVEVLRCYQERGRQCVDVRAGNGVEKAFSISLGSRQDVRGDLNKLAEMKRFARANPAPAAEPATVAIGTRRRVANPAPASIAPAPTAPASPITPPPPIEAMILAKTAPAQPAPEFSPTQFYLLCEWLKKQPLKTLPSFEALALVASQHFAMPVPDATLREAMKATEAKEPPHWNPPVEPHIVVARELAAFMKTLGAEPSAAFLDLLKPKVAA